MRLSHDGHASSWEALRAQARLTVTNQHHSPLPDMFYDVIKFPTIPGRQACGGWICYE